MTRIIIKCDRCGKEAELEEEKRLLDLAKIYLGFDRQHTYCGSDYIRVAHHEWSKEWCYKCRKELGCDPAEMRKPENKETPLPTLESFIRDLVAEEVANQVTK